jgi:hypothetical protein
MKHEIYIFGSVSRGEVSSDSDVDVLVLPFDDFSDNDYPPEWSVYTTDAVRQFHREGRLFSWHLHLEATCIFTPFRRNLLEQLGEPAPYEHDIEDIDALNEMMLTALSELRTGTNSSIFELGIVYTTLRDIATSASWRMLERPCFSRYSPIVVGSGFPLEKQMFDQMMKARHVAVRNGQFEIETLETLKKTVLEADLESWVTNLKQRLSRIPSPRRFKQSARFSN